MKQTIPVIKKRALRSILANNFLVVRGPTKYLFIMKQNFVNALQRDPFLFLKEYSSFKCL
jgi:hypothetical protein